MKWLLDFIKAIGSLMPWRGGGVDGYDRLNERLEHRLDAAESKLDVAITKLIECEDGRVSDRRQIIDLVTKIASLEPPNK